MFKPSSQTISTIKVSLHVIFIAVIGFDLFRRAFSLLPNDWLFFLTSNAVENFVCALIAYISYYFVQQFNSYLKKIGFAILFIILLFLLAALKDYRIHELLSFAPTFAYFTSFLGQLLLVYGFIFIINRFEFLSNYQQLEKELKQAKEQLLRNQLHPHFLFNAFNSLYSLSLKNDPETPAYIVKLSAMMRYLTDDTQLKKVPLYKELDFIEQYLAIEKIRFGEDARIQLQVTAFDKAEKWIEPFLLITLVENAFKHGFYTNSKAAFVKINVAINHNELHFTVENSLFSKQHFQESKREGKGLENLNKRLALLYPKSANLKTTPTAHSYTATLQITLNNE